MKPRILVFPLSLVLACSAMAGQFVWTGASNSAWTDSTTVPLNWDLIASPPVSTDTYPLYGSTYASDFLNIRNNGDLLPPTSGTTPGVTAVYNPGAGVTTTFSGGRGFVIGTGTPGTNGAASLEVRSGTIAVVRSTNVGSEPYMANRANTLLWINGGALDLSGSGVGTSGNGFTTNNFRLIHEGQLGITSTITVDSGSLSSNLLDLVFDTELDPTTVFGTGIINLNGGVLALTRFGRTAASNPGQTSFTINLNGGTLRCRNANANFLPVLADLQVLVKAGGAIIDTATFSSTIAAPLLHDPALLATPDGGLTKNSTGTLTLTATDSTYNGGTTINGGSVSITADGNLGAPSGGITFSGATTTNLIIGATIESSNRPVMLASGAVGRVVPVGGVAYTNSGKVSGTGALELRNSGTTGGTRNVTLSSLSNDFTGQVRFTYANNDQQTNLTVNSLTDSAGAGDIVFNGINNIFPTFTWGSDAVTALTLNHRRIELAGTMGTTGAVILSNANATHGITINTDLLVSGTAGARRLTLSGVAGPVNEFAGDIADGTGSAVSVVKGNNASVWTLSGNNSFTGGVTLQGQTAGSQLNINSPTALGTGTLGFGGGANGRIDNTSGAPITLTNNNPLAWNQDFRFIGSHSLNLGSGAVSLGGTREIVVSANTLTVGGVISGGAVGAANEFAALRKSGLGTMVLTGANLYKGATTVLFGTLLVNSPGSLAADSAVTVDTFATLGGNGTITGSVTVAGGSKIAPGASAAGTLSIGGGLDISALAAGSGTLNFELAALAATNDRIAVGTTLTIGDGVFGFNDFNFTNLGGLEAGTYTLLTTGGIGGTLDTAANLSGVIGAFNGTIAISGNNLVLNVTAGTGGYAAWQAANGTAGARGADHDNDGVSNGIEFFLRGAVNSTGFDSLPGVTAAGSTLSVTWTKAASGYSGTYGSGFVVETSDSLIGAWTTEIVSPNPGFTVTVTGNDVKYTFPAPLGAKKFARLKVTGP